MTDKTSNLSRYIAYDTTIMKPKITSVSVAAPGSGYLQTTSPIYANTTVGSAQTLIHTLQLGPGGPVGIPGIPGVTGWQGPQGTHISPVMPASDSTEDVHSTDVHINIRLLMERIDELEKRVGDAKPHLNMLLGCGRSRISL